MLALKATCQDRLAAAKIDDSCPALELLNERADLHPISAICLDTLIEGISVKEITR